MNYKSIILTAFLISISSVSVNADTPDQNEQYNAVRGNETEMLSYYNDAKNYRFMVFLNFDLRNAPTSDKIENVKLKMYGNAESGGGINTYTGQATPDTHTLAVYNMNNYNVGWDELKFSYNEWEYKYGYAKYPDNKIAEANGITGEGWIEWDITTDVKTVLNNSQSKLTLSICDIYIMKLPTGVNENSYVRFHSKENPSGNRPYLEFNGSGTGLETNNIAQINYTLSGNLLQICESGQSTLHIINMSGKLIHNTTIPGGNYTYMLPGSGIYLISLMNENSRFVQKIMVK